MQKKAVTVEELRVALLNHNSTLPVVISYHDGDLTSSEEQGAAGRQVHVKLPGGPAKQLPLQDEPPKGDPNAGKGAETTPSPNTTETLPPSDPGEKAHGAG